MSPDHLKEMRQATLFYHLVRHLLLAKYRDAGEEPRLALFGQLKSVVKQWLDQGYLKCSGNTYPAQLAYRQLADMAVNRIAAAITLSQMGGKPVKAVIDAYNPQGSSAFVNFNTTRKELWPASPQLCQVNYVVYDSEWEAEFCAVVEANANVLAYVKNHGLGFEVPYLHGSDVRRYFPDFIVKLDDGREDPLNLIVEIKGYRGEDAKDKAETMKAYWVPGVNNLGRFGRWAFAELSDGFAIKDDFNKLVERLCITSPAGVN
ncbi:MAG: restriction endonuclease, partial [Actinomycetes bacterium]